MYVDALITRSPDTNVIGADYVGAWGLKPPLETATGGLSPL